MYGSVTTPSNQRVHITKLYSEVVVTESLSGTRKRVRGSVYTNGGRTALRVNSVFILELVWNCCTPLYPSLSLSSLSHLPSPSTHSQITFTGIEAKTAEGCPTAEWIIRRPSKEELFLALYRHHKGHVCDKIYTVVSVTVCMPPLPSQ